MAFKVKYTEQASDDITDSLMTWPPSLFTSGKYSASGSDMMMSSLVSRDTLTISRFALNGLPKPGVPSKRSLGCIVNDVLA